MRSLAADLFAIAVEAARGESGLVATLPPLSPRGLTVIAAFGKAACAMSQAAFRHYGQHLPGVVLTRYGHGLPALHGLEGLEVVEAGHPVPDSEGTRAAAGLLALAASLGPDDQLLVLASGGGSALLVVPAAGLTLEDKQAVTRALLARGAKIQEINCVRKHLSAIKGGRLTVAAYPARVDTFVISDVVGDDPALVASGPTLPDLTSQSDALAILKAYEVDLPANVAAVLADGENETPKPGHPAFGQMSCTIVARPADALRAAAEAASAAGYTPVLLGDSVEGEARSIGRQHAELALAYQKAGGRHAIISGGELTVTLAGRGGRGGPNQEYLLSLALALDGAAGIVALACDTDGIDGSEDNAGAVIDDNTLERARARAIDLEGALVQNRSHDAFAVLDDLVVTGPTLTNVNDFRVILVDGSAQ